MLIGFAQQALGGPLPGETLIFTSGKGKVGGYVTSAIMMGYAITAVMVGTVESAIMKGMAAGGDVGGYAISAPLTGIVEG